MALSGPFFEARLAGAAFCPLIRPKYVHTHPGQERGFEIIMVFSAIHDKASKKGCIYETLQLS